MYNYFRGVLEEKADDFIVVECMGVGYQLQMGPALAQKIGQIGAEVKVYAHHYVAQDRQELFGFPDLDYKRLFELLITVNGIGPKAALSVLEVFSPETFAVHVLNDDAKALTQAKGVGKKSAERIIFDLQDKLKKSGWLEEKEQEVQGQVVATEEVSNSDKLDIIEGLIFLGYHSGEAKQMVERSYREENSVEENLRQALAQAKKV